MHSCHTYSSVITFYALPLMQPTCVYMCSEWLTFVVGNIVKYICRPPPPTGAHETGYLGYRWNCSLATSVNGVNHIWYWTRPKPRCPPSFVGVSRL